MGYVAIVAHRVSRNGRTGKDCHQEVLTLLSLVIFKVGSDFRVAVRALNAAARCAIDPSRLFAAERNASASGETVFERLDRTTNPAGGPSLDV